MAQCEMSDWSDDKGRVPCLAEGAMFVTYRGVDGMHDKIMCMHHLDWFLATSGMKAGVYDPVSLYPASDASKVRSV